MTDNLKEKIIQQLLLPEEKAPIFNNLYLHIPFCRAKCDYCAFFSSTDFDDQLIDNYCNYLVEQLTVIKDYCAPVESIYIGGGTPTLLTKIQLENIFIAIHDLPLIANCEISIESNPETLTAEKIDVIEKYCTRISLGVQSFNQQMRKIIGRDCRDEAIKKALNLIKKSSLKNNFNIDLIYGIPNQTLAMWETDLRTAFEYGCQHLSCYSLTIDEGAMLTEINEISANIDDNFAVDCANLTKTIIGKYSFIQYEISNYCLRNHECQHNNNIWHGTNYLGLGPTASSFNNSTSIRYTHTDSIELYLNGETPSIDIIDYSERIMEIFVMGLRTTTGWNQSQWEKLINNFQNSSDFITWDQLQKLFFNRLTRNNLKVNYSINNNSENLNFTNYDAVVFKNRIFLTTSGLNFWDEIAILFI
ncbi:radical SAM family heme chaperone HemW [Lentisphaerae bacterium WC36]|nr:radical SAM family heme chaperone HemW [Lentisphaerae bacterium WC36]